MSLFGTSPDVPASKSKSSLFDDEITGGASQSTSSGLFADEGPSQSGDSPWGFVTPKKQARSNVVKTLLPASAVPESYVDVFDALIESGEVAGNGVSVGGVRKLLEGSGLSVETQATTLKLITPDGLSESAGIARGEFNVLLALIGLAQEGEELSLDSVDERRKTLPRPTLPPISSRVVSPPTITKEPPLQSPPSPTHNRNGSSGANKQMQKQVYGSLDADPWGGGASAATATRSNGGSSSVFNTMAHRTTSSFTTGEVDPSSRGSDDVVPAWGNYDTGFAVNPALPGGADFGESGEGGASGHRQQRSIGGSARQGNQGAEEVVTVTSLQEKEGMFLFQYRNYEVASSRRNSKVIRRYSDFVWLLDCLHKRYPFRQLPLLPPKRVAINGNHIAADATFIEKRRKGLSRFANALVRHPVLSQEQLVVMFLTVPTELAVWRKQASISVQEEFTGKTLPPTLEESLPLALEELFDTVRGGVRRSMDIYISLCSLVERLIKRKEGMAGEFLRLANTLTNLTESSADTYKMDTNDVPMLNEGLQSSARHLATHQQLLHDECGGWDEGVLEDFKRQRDALVSMRDMFDRRDKFAGDNIPQLEKRISSNEAKLSAVRAKPDGQRKPNDAEKLEEAIMRDKESIVAQHARSVFIKECIRDEIKFFQATQYHVARLQQEWSSELVKYAELQAENWRQFGNDVESLPLGES